MSEMAVSISYYPHEYYMRNRMKKQEKIHKSEKIK